MSSSRSGAKNRATSCPNSSCRICPPESPRFHSVHVRPIPQSTNRRNYTANLQGVVSEPLTDEDMSAIAGIDRNCRLIKGQVFLWKDNQSWEDLWDPDGVIAQ